jgi:N-acetylglucosamine-6-phosphate deacetylase
MSLYLYNATLYAPEPLGPGGVCIEGGRIAAVHHLASPRTGAPASGAPETGRPDVDAIDLRGAALGPGWIDLHAHGADGVETSAGAHAVLRMGRFFARHGVTAFTPTTVTASTDDISRAVDGVRTAMADQAAATVLDGARVLGAHVEGPFLSPQRLGAQSSQHCLPPTAANVAWLLDVAGDAARVVTLAPEESGGLQAVEALAGHDIVVSLGHTVATEAQAREAFAAGARQVTHLFNGMPPMHHREPGVIGAALTAPGVRVELIADGVHLAQTTLRLAVRAKGVDDVLLVTDAMAATGCADGEYALGPLAVHVRDGEARLVSGVLAGSTLTMERAVANVARWTAVGLGGAWRMASLNPARQMGMQDRCGRLAPGYDADLTALDARGRVVLTVVGGQVVYAHRALSEDGT